MEQFKSTLTKFLKFFGFLNDQDVLSITNLTVIVFLTLTAFRGLFGGAVFSFNDFHWTVLPIDFAGTLPLLFSLINYSSKRVTLAGKPQTQTKDTNVN